jgi:zinc protease
MLDVVALIEKAMDIPYTKHALGNGLPVLIHEDHRCPIVAVNLWYHVGSKNEQPGRTGFAHLFEHLMFEGSEHYDHGYFQPLQQAGAVLNGSTNPDRTNYWEVVPTSSLELALWMESDRMGHLLPALTDEKFRNQRDVVLNERRQNYENRPYGMVVMAIVDALFPPGHPYHWLTIGSPDDLRAASLDDVRAFFSRYYHPANASLALAGDVDPDSVLAMVDAYFGGIEPGPAVGSVAHGGETAREARLVMEDAVELPRLYLNWLSPAIFAQGDADLDLVADVLADGKSSRLYRNMIYERRIATDVAAMQQSRELCGFFQLVATAAPGHTLAELEKAMSAELAHVAESGPTSAEIQRSLAQAEAQFVYRVQTVGGFGGKSDQLNQYNVFVGDPGYFGRDLQRYREATPASVAASARNVLLEAPRVAVSVVPRGRLDLALPDSAKVVCS